MSLALIAISLALHAAPTADPGEDCASCSVEGAVERAEAILSGLKFRMPRPDAGPVYGVFGASERAEQADLAGALRLARYAAARCAESGSGVCGETYLRLAELMIALDPGAPEVRAEAAGLLSLIEPPRVSRAVCARASTLRFRLAALERPWAAEPSWADACGGLGRTGELGYLAARAALIRGELDDAEGRILDLRAHAGERPIRALYLAAVLDVAKGKLSSAEARFRSIVELGPSPTRSEAEDDARNLAAVQLARLRREAGQAAEAVSLYQRVPPGSPARPEALLEGAVAAAHVGDLGAARLYLEALDHYPPRGNAIERDRVKANLAVIDGDEAVARAVFRDLSEQGRLLADRLGAVEADALASLRADPALGGLLDPALAQGFFRLEAELALLEAELEAADARLASLAAPPETELERELTRADAYLRRAERDLGIADAATQARAAALRVEVDLARALVDEDARARAARRDARRAELGAELRASRAGLVELKGRLEAELGALQGTLIARAREVVENLVMSEDVGELELAWRRKQESSRELRRIREEYDEGLATLTSDTGKVEER